jgi:hypothetical protein
MLSHDDVPEGDYDLKLTLEFFEGKDKIVDEHTSPVVVLAGIDNPQVRLLGAVPECTLARLRGMLFDTNKAFLLPSALPDLQQIRSLYEQHNPSELLVVGHTDTTADAAVNDPLSLERAKSVVAFLKDDVDAWFAFYGSSLPKTRRWGPTEDELMIGAVLGSSPTDPGNPVAAFQRARRLSETGTLDATQRKQLIREYMALDGAELDSAEFQINATAHGCGENFPLDDSGEGLDAAAADAKEDALDRRVELFFFDSEFGIVPKPPGPNSPKGSTQYPTWRKLAKTLADATLGGPLRHLTLLLLDAADEALAGAEWRIEHSAGIASGVTEDDGLVKANVPETDDTVTLIFLGERHTIDIVRDFPPTGDVSGAQARLSNLGYPSPLSGANDVQTQQALTTYQKDRKLQTTGELDSPTQQSLERVYGH